MSYVLLSAVYEIEYWPSKLLIFCLLSISASVRGIVLMLGEVLVVFPRATCLPLRAPAVRLSLFRSSISLMDTRARMKWDLMMSL
jgi:hypothetical protein